MHALVTTLLSILLLQNAPTVVWESAIKPIKGNLYELTLSGEIAPEFSIHPLEDPYSGTILEIAPSKDIQLKGAPTEEFEPVDYKGETVAMDSYILRQQIKVKNATTLTGTVYWTSCMGSKCFEAEEYSFNIDATPTENSSGKLWKLILEAILWGLLMLLTPCVFPMVPLTVSYFIRQKEGGRFQAVMYGVFIVLLYTLPLCLIIGITRAAGGETVTADIFNWLSTHWLPNLVFFTVFLIFALSFFGLFEITLPSSWTTRADANSGKAGLTGVFFLALTLVLVSFSCTGPIVGTVLIKSTQGEFWEPMITMLAFSTAFALPFSLLAFFPSVLQKLPRSGSWLNDVKVTLGFVELALGLKFLSVADQTYHWGILPREVYLIIWIILFTLLGIYWAKRRTPARIVLIVADAAFVIYLCTGLAGAPLKTLSGYLPPETPREEVVLQDKEMALPQGLKGYTRWEDALEAAQAQGKRIFVDISGHGCVNCREMESRVWSEDEVLSQLREDFVILALYIDDKTKLPRSQWVTTESGKVLKDVGRVNSHFVREHFGVNSQPNYFILSPTGETLAGPQGYTLDAGAFAAFLRQ